MSLNHIELKPSILAELFNKTLIERDAIAVPDNPRPRHLGSNGKHIAIIVQHDTVPFLPDGELAFLSSVLAACKLSLADVALVNFDGDATTLQSGLQDLDAVQVLLFGVEPLKIGLPIHFPPFQLQQFNKRTYVWAPPLSQIESDKGVKQKLWVCLKNLFGI